MELLCGVHNSNKSLCPGAAYQEHTKLTLTTMVEATATDKLSGLKNHPIEGDFVAAPSASAQYVLLLVEEPPPDKQGCCSATITLTH